MSEPMDQAAASRAAGRRNYVVLAACGVFVASMVGMSFAAAPLYSLYCRVTGYNGTVQQVEQASSVVLDERIRVEFDTNIAGDLDWEFKPAGPAVDPRIGETVQVNFRVTNRSDKVSTGQAVFNVTPLVAGAYFNKLECFCFTDVTLKPGETRDMPVVFYIDPEIVNTPETKEMKVLTLSYTLYSRENPKPVAAVIETKTDGSRKL